MKALKACGCVTLSVPLLLFGIPILIVACPAFDGARYGAVIRDLRAQGAIPPDLRLKGAYLSRMPRENTYVLLGVATNFSFLSEPERHNEDVKADGVWRSLDIDDTFGSGLKEILSDDAKEWRRNEENFFNGPMRLAGMRFRCVSNTPLFYRRMKSDSVWLALDGEKVFVVVRTQL